MTFMGHANKCAMLFGYTATLAGTSLFGTLNVVANFLTQGKHWFASTLFKQHLPSLVLVEFIEVQAARLTLTHY